MKTAAVIAEYNPFHKGHEYHLLKTRAMAEADYIIVVMSGDFVQRGAPAMMNKYLRTKMALAGGADVVIELPSRYALSSAEGFAEGAVSHYTGFDSAIRRRLSQSTAFCGFRKLLFCIRTP